MAATHFSGPVVSATGFVTGSSDTGPGFYSGSGVPSLSAGQGSLYVNTTASTSATRLYINTNGTTGWTAFTSAA